MKKVIVRSLFLCLVTVILFYYILKDNFNESILLLSKSNLIYIFFAIVCYVCFILLEAYLIKILINKINKKYSMKKASILTIMTRFFNGITPFSVGGEPLQVYELSKENIKISDSILIITEAFIIHEIAVCFLALISIICKIIFHLNPNNFVWSITLIGFFVNFIIILVVTFISIKINVAKKIGDFFIKLLNRLNIIKNKDKTIEEWHNKCTEYSIGYKELLKNKSFLLNGVLIIVGSMLFNFLIAYFSVLAIDATVNINVIYSLILSSLIYISATFIPIPGGSVGIEYCYLNYFALLIPENIVITSLVVWRFISFYLPMIIGGIVFNIIDNKRTLKCKEENKN